MQSSDFFTPKEAAHYLGVSTNTLRKYLKNIPKKAHPPMRKFSKRLYRFPKTDFIKWAHPPKGK